VLQRRDLVEVERVQQALRRVQAAQPRPDALVDDPVIARRSARSSSRGYPRPPGADLCRRLKAAEATRAIPVILMSALPSGGATGVGEEAFLGKPFDLVELEGLVWSCLGRSRE
jgi:CheY-like chemotaxis protein